MPEELEDKVEALVVEELKADVKFLERLVLKLYHLEPGALHEASRELRKRGLLV